MKIKVIDSSGGERDALEWGDELLVRDRGDRAVHQAVVATLARRRRGTASTRTRGEVRASGRKLFRQKGTGRARQGAISAPHWRGGGVAFGPRPRSYAHALPRKVKRLAYRRALSAIVDRGDLVCVEDLELDAPKTRLLVERLRAVAVEAPALIVVDEVARNLQLAARNLPRIEVMRACDVDTYRLLRYGRVVATRAGAEILRERMSEPAKPAAAADKGAAKGEESAAE